MLRSLISTAFNSPTCLLVLVIISELYFKLVSHIVIEMLTIFPGFFRTILNILTRKEQPSGAGVMVVMQLVWHWQKTNKMCLNVEFQLPLSLIGVIMVSCSKTL